MTGFRDRTATIGIATGVAILVATGLAVSGGYYALAAGILGGVVAITAVALLTLGLAPARPAVAAASMLVALGTWSVVSASWGGLPQVSWRFVGLMIAGASALIAGSALGEHAHAIVSGVLIGITVHAVIVLATVGSGSAPTDWFRIRQLEGPIGYHNGEATICAMGVPLALWVATSDRRSLRAAGAAAAVLFLSIVLLTQSRGSLAAVALAVLAQLALARRGRLAVLAVLLASSAAALFFSLRRVDRALIDGRPLDDPAFRNYALVTLLVALVVGGLSSMSLPANRLTRRRTYTVVGAAVAVTVVVATIGLAVLATHVDDLRDRITAEPNRPSEVVGGDTRLSSFSPTGRVKLWQLALDMSAEAPAVGHGAGSFARRWTIDRTNKDAYVLQPHSLELELLAELGIVGLVLLTAAIGGLTWGVVRGVRRDRAVGGSVAGALLAFLLVASVDWIHSFAGLLIPAMLLAGAAAAQGRRRIPSVPRAIGYILLVLVALGVLAGPAVAQRQLDKARSQAATSSASAWATAASARRWDRWDPAVIEFQGLLAEHDGRFLAAAGLYRRAATLSVQPWMNSYREARALQRAGRLDEARAACRRARTANPLGADLQDGVCYIAVSSGSVTYEGRSLTLKGVTRNGSIATSEIWYLVAPPLGAGTVKVRLSTPRTIVAGAISFKGAHQSLPLGAYSGSAGNTNSVTSTVASARGEIVIDSLSLKWASGRTATANPGQTQKWSRAANDGRSGIIGGVSTAPGAGSVRMGWTFNAADIWAHGLVAVEPASSGGSARSEGELAVDASTSAASSGNVSSLSWSHRSSGADRLLVVVVSRRDS